MARGRGRGWGRGWKIPLMTIGSSVGTRVEGEKTKSQEQSKTIPINEGGMIEKVTTTRSEVARRLSLNTPPPIAELQGNSDENFDDGKGINSNETVKVDAEKEAIHIADTEGITEGQSIEKEQKKP
ncbi:hypothetical protein H5410_021446 [Solanum commersonii]|uniref:Uncharacterized protein n=1 Tax=Solanum commersonii TaxID=4109 RepID=A0A9J5ZCM5_SOLCO|nr:hypothetical protein H5410_021446 [Solanum commersonii]